MSASLEQVAWVRKVLEQEPGGGQPPQTQPASTIAAPPVVAPPVDGGIPAAPPLAPAPPDAGPQMGAAPRAALNVRVRAPGADLAHVEARRPKDYAGPTIGFERELIGPNVTLTKEADRGVLGTVSLASEALVDIMTDIGTHPSYTIELRSTPCEKNDRAKLGDRRSAMNAIVEAIRAIDRETGKLTAVAGYQLAMRIKDCKFRRDAEVGVGFADQTSVGIKTSALMPGNPDFELLKSNAEWLKDPAPGALPRDGLAEPDKAIHFRNMVASVVAFLAKILKAGPGPASSDDLGVNIFQSDTKNSWGVLPRSPARDWLDTLGEADRAAVMENLREQFAPPPPAGPAAALDADAEKAARCNAAAWAYVSQRQDLAGHPVPPATIGGEPSGIFEFRSPPHQLGLDVAAAPEAPPVVQPPQPQAPDAALAAELARRRRQAQGGAEDDDEEC